MTEAEWNSCADPQAMLEFLRKSGKPSERKLRLFAAACCRRIWHLLRDERAKRAVEVAERFADALATADELTAASAEADITYDTNDSRPEAGRGRNVAFYSAYAAASTAWGYPHVDDSKWPLVVVDFCQEAEFLAGMAGEATKNAGQVVLLRDIMGSPARPFAITPADLTWNNGIIARLAQRAYEERSLPDGTLDLTRLAVLADALEEAGVTDTLLLKHLRGPGPHVRGCFAIDAILGQT